MSDVAIVVRNLRKHYIIKERLGLLRSRVKVIEALRGVSFSVRYGEVVGLLGPNGAGKTTLIKILATLLLPDSGEAYIAGYDVVREAKKVRKIIGVMLSVEKGFYGKLTGRENLEYFAALYDLDLSYAKTRIKYLLNLLGLDELGASNKLFEEYSLGMKARLALARALLRDPQVLLLDEPTLGLDPLSARRIRDLVKKLAREGKAVLLTSHNLFEVEAICDRVLLINKGLIIAEGSPEDLKNKVSRYRRVLIKLRKDLATSKVLRLIQSTYKPSLTTEVGNNYVELKLMITNDDEFNLLLRELMRNNCKVLDIKIESPSLEDVFVRLLSIGSKE